MKFYQCADGLRVYYECHPHIPLVAAQVWLQVGSLDEDEGQFGAAHFIEHMLFKGTAHWGVGDISHRIESLGGDINAYTSFDHTVIHAQARSQFQTEIIDVLLKCAFASNFDPNEVESERKVILEEIRRNLDDPHFVFSTSLLETIFGKDPISRPITASINDVQNLSLESLQRFHQQFYQPTLGYLVLVGGIDEASLIEQLRQFESTPMLQSKTMFAAVATPSPKSHFISSCNRFASTPLGKNQAQGSLNPRILVQSSDQGMNRIDLAFVIPGGTSHDNLALSIASYVFAQMDSSYLHLKLVEELGIADHLAASVTSLGAYGFLNLSFICGRGGVPPLLAALAQEIESFSLGAWLDEASLAAVRAAFRMDRALELESVEGRAGALGAAIKSPLGLGYLDFIEKGIATLGMDQVKDALRRWVRIDHAHLGVMTAEGDSLDLQEVSKYWQDARTELANKTASPSSKQRSMTNASLRKVAPKVEPIKVQLGEGLEGLFFRQTHSNITQLTMISQGGLSYENALNHGHHAFWASMLGEAHQNIDALDLAKIFESKGAFCGGFSGKDSIGLKFQCLDGDFAELMPEVAACLLAPAFPEDKFSALKRQVLQTIDCQGDEPSALAMLEIQKLVYSDHPYGKPVYGCRDSIESISSQAMLKSFEEHRDEGPWTLAVVSNQDPNQLVKLLQKSLKGWKPHAQLPAPRHLQDGLAASAEQGKRAFIERDREQSHVIWARRGSRWADPQRYTWEVLTAILGGASGSLFMEVRDRMGLVYNISPLLILGRDPGLVGVYYAAQKAHLGAADQTIFALLEGMAQNPIEANEITRAQNYLIGGYLQELQRGESLSLNLSLHECLGSGSATYLAYPEKILAVQPKDVQTLAHRLCNQEHWHRMEVGPN